MRVWVLLACQDAETTIGTAIAAIPRQIAGADTVTVLVVDDGSRDGTAAAAHGAGADCVVRLPHPRGHAQAFAAGLEHSRTLGADVIINLDPDHTCAIGDLDRLVRAVLDGRADIVIGHRVSPGRAQVRLVQRALRAMGSRTLSVLANLDVPDATSSVRAYSREAALKLNVFSKVAYTLDTLVQAGKKDLTVTHVPVSLSAIDGTRVRPSLSRYLRRSIPALLRVYALYEPLRTFFWIGAALFGVGLVGFVRFLALWLTGAGGGHVQSLMISGVLLIIGFQLWMLGILADVISVNRRLSEDILCRLKREEIAEAGEAGGVSFRSRPGRS